MLGLGFYMLHAVIQVYASELAPAARGSAIALHSFFFFWARLPDRPSIMSASITMGTSAALVLAGAVLILNGLVAAHYLRRPDPV